MKFIRPIDDSTPTITSTFGPNHKGVDYGYVVGTRVYAAADGIVGIAKGNETRQWVANSASDPFKPATGNRALRTEDYGNLIRINHEGGFASLYAHLKYNSLFVTVGQAVKQGQLIGLVGSTGNSTGNHLHWEPRLNEAAIDPTPYMDFGFTNYFEGSSQPQPSQPSMSEEDKKAIEQWRKLQSNPRSGGVWYEAQNVLKSFEDLDTQLEQARREAQGHKGRATDLQNQLTQALSDKENRELQVSRLKDQLLEENKLSIALQDNLKKTLETIEKNEGIYRDRIASLQGQIDQMGKDLGTQNTKIRELENKLLEAKKGDGISLTVGDLLVRIFNKLKNVQI